MPIETVQPDTVLELQSEPLGRVVVTGPRNTLRVGADVVLNLTFWLQGSGTTIEIEDGCHLTGMIRVVRGEGGLIRIGRGTTFNGVGLSMHEAGQIHVGEDCMFSNDIHMDVSDMHPIYDRASGQRINPARDIHIGRHVWIGTRVWVNKGARIGEGAVIGSGAMVAGEIPPHSLAIGTPARVVRQNVDWRREFDEPYEAVAGAQPPVRAPGWLDRLRGRRRPR